MRKQTDNGARESRIPNPKSKIRSGFTLIEILVVIGIIVILIGILIPVISKARKAAQATAVMSQIKDLEGVIQQYQQDHGALPGPLAHNQIRTLGTPAVLVDTASDEFVDDLDGTRITMAENMVLGLAGGLKAETTTGLTGGGTVVIRYDPSLVGAGAMNLNPANPKKGRAYIDQKNLSWRTVDGRKTGKYEDGAGAADDSEIPEILDTFPNPMPILYLRARKGQQAPGAVATWDDENNYIVTYTPTGMKTDRPGQYDLRQIAGYTDTTIGEGKSIRVSDYAPTNNQPASAGELHHGLASVTLDASLNKGDPKYQYPYDAYAYFRDPGSPDSTPAPRARDGYILISAGIDRVYGTADDITSFGSVLP